MLRNNLVLCDEDVYLAVLMTKLDCIGQQIKKYLLIAGCLSDKSCVSQSHICEGHQELDALLVRLQSDNLHDLSGGI